MIAQFVENGKLEMAIKLTWPNSTTAWQSFLVTTKLVPEVAVRALALGWYAKEFLGVDLQLESAYRSPEYNKQLQRRWDAGDRAGLKARPADSSLHSEGRAFDVSFIGPQPAKETWAAIGGLGEALGLRWGGRFQNPDPVHFDL